MPLTDTAIRNAKPTGKPFKLFDDRGLFLLVTPSGGKWWRIKYRFDGKEKTLSMGIYPDVTLAKARDRRDELRKLLADGIDPGAHRKAAKGPAKRVAARAPAAKPRGRASAPAAPVQPAAPALPSEVERILQVVPALRFGERVQLNSTVEPLRQAGLLAKSAASTKLFKKHADWFELTPEKQPNKVQYRGG